MAFLAASIPIATHAGFLDFARGLFNKPGEFFEEKQTNSQNMSLLYAALNPDPNPAKGGGEITIIGGSALLPDSGPSGTLADIEVHTNTSDKISLYVVREGDSVSQIAKMFGVTTNTIVWANDLPRNAQVNPGQTLVILPISGIQHTVKRGDTLQGLAKQYKADLGEIVSFNGFSEETTLSIGQVVMIPDGEAVPVQGTSRVAQGTSAPSYEGYYVRPLNGGSRSQGLHGYNAVDLAAPRGTPIFAAASGQVIISRQGGWNGGYGSYIVIRHPNGTQTLYAHNSRNIVQQGWQVVQGQVIGYVGSTGRSTGDHLHFEIRGARNPF